MARITNYNDYDAPCILVGCKYTPDEEYTENKREVSQSRAEEFAVGVGMSYIEVDPKTGENVEKVRYF